MFFIKRTKILFYIGLFTRVLVAVSADNYGIFWLGLEVNIMSFCAILVKSETFSVEGVIKYFLIQALASQIIILRWCSILLFYTEVALIIRIALFIKLGVAPLHFWFPSVAQRINWSNNIVLITIQKLSPLVILTKFDLVRNLVYTLVLLNIFLGGLGGLNQTSLRKLLAFSSVTHMGWILCAWLFAEKLWVFYYLLYCLVSLSVIIILDNDQHYQIRSIFKGKDLKKYLAFIVRLLSLGGFPPFVGFIGKWIVVYHIVKVDIWLLSLIALMGRIISLYFYLRVVWTGIFMTFPLKGVKHESLGFKNSRVILFNIVGGPLAWIIFIL